MADDFGSSSNRSSDAATNEAQTADTERADRTVAVPQRSLPQVGMITRFTCWFSRRFWDIHDYPVSRGGDGFPSHFYTYHCWNCGKEFGI